ncbi:hypothetical protein GGC64_004704 [Mycobacterium sp. OAS707]|uniref:hypothetical protein n=1 Tax=Mycobacterium sp. OAS707 TaxID=2663822 RepID=UPI001789A90A|nr:hypothetical protein [Mycobacterium sp. OAS707]MBE1550664.1 hypothetical protein [Mycobacterium sp. OAS707]
MTSPSIRTRRGAALAFVVVAIAAACTSEPDNAAAPTATSPSQQAPQEQRACQAALPAAWQQAIESNRVDAGGSTMALAVGRAGEVVAVRDNGDTRDLLLIGADKSVKPIYGVPEPNRNDVGFAAIDDRWIVVGIDRIPRGANGVLPTLFQIDLIDRSGGAVRTVVKSSEDDYGTGGPTIDSVALFDGKVYWITHEKYASSNGTMRSYDVNTGAIAEVKAGSMDSVRASAVGVTALVDRDSKRKPWERAEVITPAQLPTPVADAVGTGPDRLSLTTDGNAYAWFTGVDHGVSGVAWWSPESGLVRVTGDAVGGWDGIRPIWVMGPYVVSGIGRQETDTWTTVIDTRSGAVVNLGPWAVGADGGTIALSAQHGPGGKAAPTSAVVLRADQLPPLTC